MLELWARYFQSKQVTSYVINWGSWGPVHGWDGIYGPDYLVDFLGYRVLQTYPSTTAKKRTFKPLRIEDITDGLSNTAAFSETVIDDDSMASGDTDSHYQGHLFDPDPDNLGYAFCPRVFDIPTARDLFLAADWRTRAGGWAARGKDYTYALPSFTGYYHMLPPNSPNWINVECDLANFCDWEFNGTYPAGSWHAGGVNLLLCDGRVCFIRNQIDPDTWTALGTRRSGESVELID